MRSRWRSHRASSAVLRSWPESYSSSRVPHRRERTARRSGRAPSAAPGRGLALPRQSRGRGAPRPLARRLAPARRDLLPGARRPRDWNRDVAPEGWGLRGGVRARPLSSRSSLRADSHFDRRAAFFSGALSPRWLAARRLRSCRRSGSASSPSSTWSTRTTCGGNSSSRPTHRASCGRRWDRPRLFWCSLSPAPATAAPELPACRPTRSFVWRETPSPARADAAVPRLPPRQGSSLRRVPQRRSSCTVYRAGPGSRSGDPVGPSGSAAELVRPFLETVDDYGGTPVFYQVSPRRLHVYADFGLVLAKLGEQARVDLAGVQPGGPRAQAVPQHPESHPEGGRVVSRLRTGGRRRLASRASAVCPTSGSALGRRREGLLARLLRRELPAPIPAGRRRAWRARSWLSPTSGRARRRRSSRWTSCGTGRARPRTLWRRSSCS